MSDMYPPKTLEWAGGLYVGEGSTTLHDTVYLRGLRMKMVMTDEETVREFAEIVGVGKVYGPYRNGQHARLDQWEWTVVGIAAEAAYVQLEPFFNGEKRRQGERVLSALS